MDDGGSRRAASHELDGIGCVAEGVAGIKIAIDPIPGHESGTSTSYHCSRSMIGGRLRAADEGCGLETM